MFVSASPDGANRQAMEACARTKIPMAGTGGSGVALTQNMGCNVLSASGTTGTTNRTRAVAFTTALAKYWKIKYMPVIGNTGENVASKAEGNIWKRINFRGIMMTSLPAFIAMALCLACSKIPGCGSLSDVFDTLVNSIPIVICAIAAKQVSGLDGSCCRYCSRHSGSGWRNTGRTDHRNPGRCACLLYQCVLFPSQCAGDDS